MDTIGFTYGILRRPRSETRIRQRPVQQRVELCGFMDIALIPIPHQRAAETIPVHRGRLEPVVSDLGLLVRAGMRRLAALVDDLLEVDVVAGFRRVGGCLPECRFCDAAEGLDERGSGSVGRTAARRGGLVDSDGSGLEVVVFVLFWLVGMRQFLEGGGSYNTGTVPSARLFGSSRRFLAELSPAFLVLFGAPDLG